MSIETLGQLRAAPRLLLPIGLPSLSLTAYYAGLASWWTSNNPSLDAVIPPDAGEVPTLATQGAAPFPAPPATKHWRLSSLSVSATAAFGSSLVLYDRLWHCSGLVGNVTTAQSVPTAPALRGGSVGVEIWLEIYTQLGSTAPGTVIVTYTNQAGTGGRVGTCTPPGHKRDPGECMRVQLQAGDTGVQSVESVQLGISTGAAGEFGVTFARPLASLPFWTGFFKVDALRLGLPLVEDDACLAFAIRDRGANNSTVEATGNAFIGLELALE